jgi:drug/metabolite transporter (DMT)-like permease
MGVSRPDNSTITAPVTDVHRGRRVKATVMLVILCAIWGLTFPITRMSVVDTDPIQFIALRFGLAFPVLYSFLMLRYRGRIRPTAGDSDEYAAAANVGLSGVWVTLRNGPLRNVWLRGATIGIILFAGFSFQVLGLEHTTASRSGFFTGLLVVLTPPVAMFLRTSHTPRVAWLALLPALIGIYLIADPETGGMNIGDWLTICSAVMFAIQMVILEALTRSEAESRALTIAQVFTIGLLAGMWSLIQGNVFEMTTTGWIGIAYTAIFGSVIAVWLQTRFQPNVPAAHAGFIFALEPVFASLFAWMLIGESWTFRGLTGAAFILGAMGISSFALSRADHQPVNKSSMT